MAQRKRPNTTTTKRAAAKATRAVHALATSRELSDFLNVSRATIRRMREAGQIPFYRVGNRYRYDVASVKSALAKFS